MKVIRKLFIVLVVILIIIISYVYYNNTKEINTIKGTVNTSPTENDQILL